MKKIQKAKNLINSGSMLAIDPATGSKSQVGFALFEGGELMESGEIVINSKETVFNRLYELSQKLMGVEVDVLVIEKIRGRQSHAYLKWAVGCIVGTVFTQELIEISPPVWKKYTHLVEDYEKTDEKDAIAIGIAAIKEANNEVRRDI